MAFKKYSLKNIGNIIPLLGNYNPSYSTSGEESYIPNMSSGILYGINFRTEPEEMIRGEGLYCRVHNSEIHCFIYGARENVSSMAQFGESRYLLYFIKEGVYEYSSGTTLNVTSDLLNRWIYVQNQYNYNHETGMSEYSLIIREPINIPTLYFDDTYYDIMSDIPGGISVEHPYEPYFVTVYRYEMSMSEQFMPHNQGFPSYIDIKEIFNILESSNEDPSNPDEPSIPNEPEEILPNIAELDLNKIGDFIPHLQSKLIELKNFDSQVIGWRYGLTTGESYELLEDPMYSSYIHFQNPIEAAYINFKFSNGEIINISSYKEQEGELYYFTKEQEFEKWDASSGMTKYINITSDMLNKWMAYSYIGYDSMSGSNIYNFIEIVENKVLFSPKVLTSENLWAIFDNSEEIVFNNRRFNISAVDIRTGYSMEMGGTNRFSGDIEILRKFYECCRIETAEDNTESKPYTTTDLLNDMAKIIQTAEGNTSKKIKGVDMPVRLQAVIDNLSSNSGGNNSGDSIESTGMSPYDIRSYSINNKSYAIPDLFEISTDKNYKLTIDWENLFTEKNMISMHNPSTPTMSTDSIWYTDITEPLTTTWFSDKCLNFQLNFFRISTCFSNNQHYIPIKSPEEDIYSDMDGASIRIHIADNTLKVFLHCTTSATKYILVNGTYSGMSSEYSYNPSGVLFLLEEELPYTNVLENIGYLKTTIKQSILTLPLKGKVLACNEGIWGYDVSSMVDVSLGYKYWFMNNPTYKLGSELYGEFYSKDYYASSPANMLNSEQYSVMSLNRTSFFGDDNYSAPRLSFWYSEIDSTDRGETYLTQGKAIEQCFKLEYCEEE